MLWLLVVAIRLQNDSLQNIYKCTKDWLWVHLGSNTTLQMSIRHHSDCKNCNPIAIRDAKAGKWLKVCTLYSCRRERCCYIKALHFTFSIRLFHCLYSPQHSTTPAHHSAAAAFIVKPCIHARRKRPKTVKTVLAPPYPDPLSGEEAVEITHQSA